jgi:hypothetical protein
MYRPFHPAFCILVAITLAFSIVDTAGMTCHTFGSALMEMHAYLAGNMELFQGPVQWWLGTALLKQRDHDDHK